MYNQYIAKYKQNYKRPQDIVYHTFRWTWRRFYALYSLRFSALCVYVAYEILYNNHAYSCEMNYSKHAILSMINSTPDSGRNVTNIRTFLISVLRQM